MANLAAFNGKAVLDWTLLGATPTRNTQIWMGVSKSAPNSTDARESTQTAMPRQTISFAAAASPANLSTNSLACTFGPASSLTTVRGWSLWSTSGTFGSGNMLFLGTFTTAPVCSAGDTVVVALGALSISIT